MGPFIFLMFICSFSTIWNQSPTAKPPPVIFLTCSWTLECLSVTLVSLQTLLFCLFSLFYVPGYTSCRSIIHLSKCLRLQKHLFILSPLFCLIPMNPAATRSVPCFCHLFSPQVPHKSGLPLKHLLCYSEETFGHSPTPRVSSVPILRCSLCVWDVL